MSKVVEASTSLFQYALSTRAGCECVAHILQALCEINPETSVVSDDGINDVISRRSMLEGLHSVDGGAEALPFVRMFHSFPSQGRTRRGWCTPLTRVKGEITSPARTGAVVANLQQHFFTHARIRLHGARRKSGMGRDQAIGVRGVGLDCPCVGPSSRGVEVICVASRGAGIKVLGTPFGHPEFVTDHLERIMAEHRVLLDRIPAV